VVWKSDTYIFAKIASGFGGSKKLSLTSGMQLGVFTPVSYNMVTLKSGYTGTSPTTGRTLVFSGKQFAAFESSSQSRLAYTANRASFWSSDSSAACKAAGGSAKALDLWISSEKLDDGVFIRKFVNIVSFDTVLVSLKEALTCSTTGSSKLSLFGIHFGSN